MAVQKYRERKIKPYLICNNVSRSTLVGILFHHKEAFVDITKLPENPILVDTYKMYYENTQLRIYGHDSPSVSALVYRYELLEHQVTRIDISEDLFKLYHNVLRHFNIEVLVCENEMTLFNSQLNRSFKIMQYQMVEFRNDGGIK